MKNTKLFTAFLCGTMLLSACKFTGTEGTFEKDIKAKYENSDEQKTVVHSSVLEVVSKSPFAAIDEDNDGVTDKWVAEIVMSDSMENLDAFSMLKLEDGSELWAETKPFTDVEFKFDETDITKTKIIVTYKFEEKPVDYVLQIDGTKAKSVTGKMLDEDGDDFWGEAEDTLWVYTDTTNITKRLFIPNLYWKGGISFSINENLTDNNVSISCSIPEEKDYWKTELDSLFKLEYYDVAGDKWTALSLESSEVVSNTYTAKYAGCKEAYYRVISSNLVGKKFTVGGKEITYTNDNSVKYEQYITYSFIYGLTDVPSFSPLEEDLTGYFTVTKKTGYMDLQFSGAAISDWYNSENKYSYTDTFVKLNGVSKETVKVFSCAKVNGIKTNLYEEIPVKEVKVINDDTIRILFEDTEKNSTDSTLTVTVTPAVEAEYKGYIDSDPSDSMKVSLGHLCVSTSTLTKGGNSIIK